MFAQVGVRTIVAGGAPHTGPMQAVGGNRGAVLFSADELDEHLSQLSLLDVNDTVLATLPERQDDEYRDSGVFTTILGVNLRDQVRPNDTTPLQFKYEAADCRIFYTLDNVYNMSRLWRDAVTASFDNPSLCVEGSTGFRNSSMPAPEPILNEPATLDFDFGEPDEFLVADGLDLTGGPQGDGGIALSGRVTLCNPGCEHGSRCEDVLLKSCQSNTQVTVKRCIPRTSGQSYCPAGTIWKQSVSHGLKGQNVKKGAFGQPTVKVKTGPCIPDSRSGVLCG